MFGIGTGELLLLLIIALIVLGPERMPKLARDLGRALAEFRKTSDELRSEFLNADKYLDAAPSSTPAEQPAIAAPTVPEAPLTEAAVATDPSGQPLEPDETLVDKEAREARAQLRDPERLG
ncbi:MAG: Sec-independent protein translocase subunit TatA/TatB [Candidatus Limnocylindria bacterium]